MSVTESIPLCSTVQLPHLRCRNEVAGDGYCTPDTPDCRDFRENQMDYADDNGGQSLAVDLPSGIGQFDATVYR